MTANIEGFKNLSVDLTGFSEFELFGTGNMQVFYDLLKARIGKDCLTNLLDAHSSMARNDLKKNTRHSIMADQCFGPIARNLVYLWFLGTWRTMPVSWTEKYGAGLENHQIIPSSSAYTSGLLWPTISGNPPGAKPFGYAMWANPPKFTSKKDILNA
jgi:hypothetical protein